MIFDESAVRNMAKQAAIQSGQPQVISILKTGEYVFCSEANLSLLKQALDNKPLQYIDTIKPEYTSR